MMNNPICDLCLENFEEEELKGHNLFPNERFCEDCLVEMLEHFWD